MVEKQTDVAYGRAKAVYDKLTQDREDYTRRAEECAKYTIPRLFPREYDDSGTDYATPYNSVGARGVNNLASKLLLALLPPNQPFFRFGLDEESMTMLKESNNEQMKDAIELGLSMLENAVVKYMEANSLRPTLSEAIKQLIVAGNALLFLPPKEGGVKCYKLRNYVVQRDGTGNVLQIVAKDTMSRASLPDYVSKFLNDHRPVINEDSKPSEEKVDIYTHTYLDGNRWMSYQEIDGFKVPKSEQTYPKDKLPWMPIRFSKIDGENYGRSFVEDFLGDLRSLEVLSQSIVDLSKIAAKVVYLVSPSCQTNIQALAKARNGAYVKGRVDDVVPVQLNKSADMQVTMSTASNIEQRLSFCFLLNSAVQTGAQGRDRVTAEEIRYVAGELEDTLGGTYSLLSNELQMPLVKCIFNQMQSNGQLPDFGEFGSRIEPTIVTGVDALGRGHDLANLTQAMTILSQFPDVMQSVNQNNLALRVFTSAHIDPTGLIKTPEQIEQERQAQMQMYQQQVATDTAGQVVADQARAQAQ
jgi:hypothetical protein